MQTQTTTGYLNLQSCVRIRDVRGIRGDQSRGQSIFAERRRCVSAACLHSAYVCIHINEKTHLPRSWIRPGKRRSVVPSLVPSLISDKAISIYRVSSRVFVAVFLLLLLRPPSSSSHSVALRNFSPLRSWSNPRALPPAAERQARTFSRNSREKRKRPKARGCNPNVSHSRTRFRCRSHRSLPCSRRTFVHVTWRPVSDPPVVCFLSSSRSLLVWSKKHHFLSVPPIIVSSSSVKCHSLLYLSRRFFFNNKLSRRPSDPFDIRLLKCLFECFQVSSSASPRLYFALAFSIDLSENNKLRSARSLARSLQVPFLLSPYCLHLVLVSITLAPVRLTGRCCRQRTFTSRAAFGRVFGNQAVWRVQHLSAGDATLTNRRSLPGIPFDIFSLSGSDRTRNSRRPEKTLPLTRSIDPSIDTADFPSSGCSHWIQDDPATFHRSFSRSFLPQKEIKRKRKERKIRSISRSSFVSFFFFYTRRNEIAIDVNYSRSKLAPRLFFPTRNFRRAVRKAEFRIGRECSRSYLPFSAGVEWRLSFLPTLSLPPACLSLPPLRDHRAPTTHSSRIYAITAPCSTPCGRCSSSTRWPLLFFLNFVLSRGPRKGSMKLLTDAAKQDFHEFSLYVKK